MTTQTIVQLSLLLLPILVPLVMRGVKAAAPKLPTWLVPILASLLGAVTSGLTGVATGAPDIGTAFAVGGAGGLMGVGMREFYDQGGKAVVAVQAGKNVPRVDDRKT